MEVSVALVASEKLDNNFMESQIFYWELEVIYSHQVVY